MRCVPEVLISRLTRVMCALAFLLLGSLPSRTAFTQPAPAAIPSDASPAERRILETGTQALADSRSDARRVLDEIVDGTELGQARPSYQQLALNWAATLAYRDRQIERAHALMLRATAMPGATADNWQLLVLTSVMSRDADAAMRALTTFAERWPERLAATDPGSVQQVVELALSGHEGDVRLLTALFNAKWQRPVVGEPSEVWRVFALTLLDRGDTRLAADVVKRIVTPDVLVRMHADRRFDTLVGGNRSGFDVRSAAAAQIEQLRSNARAAPDSIAPILALSSALAENNQCAEALRVVDDALARAASATAETRPYLDGGLYFVWLLNERARNLACLGRWDEAVSQQLRASQLTEHGERNVSQTINLAHLYTTVGRPVDALAALETVGRMSGFGKMEEQWARLRAHLQLGNAEDVRAALAYLREHRGEGIDAYQLALLEAGETEAAAALLIERLENPRERAYVLGNLQLYAESPSTPIGAERKTRWAALITRSDVRTAVERVGRVHSYPFMRPRLSVE